VHNLKKGIFISFILILIITGCYQKKETVTDSNSPIIEIYIPKERIPSLDGGALPPNWNSGEPSEDEIAYRRKFLRLDTISQRLIYAGRYAAKASDLQNSPLIENNDVLGFNFKTNKLKLSRNGVKKLFSILPNFNFSRQFIITADKKPILNGYLFSTFSSSYVSHFYIKYARGTSEPDLSRLIDEQEFEIYYNPTFEFDYGVKKYEYQKNVNFYKAFKNRQTNK